MRNIIKFKAGDAVMRVSAKLAKEIGLKESILLLQIEYIISLSNNLKDDKYWTNQNITQIQKYMFPFLSPSTFYRILDKLIKEGYVLKYKGFYSLDENKLSQLRSIYSQNDSDYSQNESNYSQNESTLPQSKDEDYSQNESNYSQNDSKDNSQNESNYCQNDSDYSQNDRLIKNKNKSIKNNKEEEEDLICSNEQINQSKIDLLDTDENKLAAQAILDEWNSVAKVIEGLTSHNSLNSKVRTGKKTSTKLMEVISTVLLEFSQQAIIESIKNYSFVLQSDQHYYNYRFETLSLFLISDKGIKQFLLKDNISKLKKGYENPIEELYNVFKPITEVYDNQNILDTGRQTYLGFHLDSVKQIEYIKEEFDYLIRNKYREIEYSDFCDLELIIAGLLFRRKKKPQLAELTKYIGIWNEWKSRFKDTAIKLLQEKIDDRG